MLPRKELFKNTLRKAATAYKRIVELRLTGELFSSDKVIFTAFNFLRSVDV